MTEKTKIKRNKELNVVLMPGGSLQLEWDDTEETIDKTSIQLQEEIYNRYTAGKDSWLLFLGFCDKNAKFSPSLDFWRNYTGLFARALSRTPDIEIHRHQLEIPIQEETLDKQLSNAPMMTGSENLSTEILESVWTELNCSFSCAIEIYDGTVEEFIHTYSRDIHLAGRIFFHLVESKAENTPFAFVATYSTRVTKEGKSKHLQLKNALREYGNDHGKLLELLATVHLAEKQSTFIANLLETGELFQALLWTPAEAFTFLKEIPIYEESGILCRIPNWWKGSKGSSSGLRLNITVGNSAPSFVGMNAILNFNTQLFLGDTPISVKEAKRLLQETEGLAFIKNKWIAVDPEKLKQTLEAYEKAKKMMDETGFSMRDALRLQLNPEKVLNQSVENIEIGVSNGEWLDSVLQKLLHPQLITTAHPDPSKFKAQLREYQEKGLNWLNFLHSLGFGACLADDMGLGKTVQVLGFMSILKSEKPRSTSLLVIPASLISNWLNEIERFTPELKVFVAHPDSHPGKTMPALEKELLDGMDLVITTYALVQRYKHLQAYQWTYVILDEAQAIKNPGTKQTKAVKKLNTENRIIMTGTPVENRLSDLWSLFDFLNPGLLGSVKEFNVFSKSLKDHPAGYSRLRNLIRPYILRRLKTDKSVISDLPDKVEMKTYAMLNKKQVLLYKELIDTIRETIEETIGIQRKGLILASLMKFKQLCNHPDQYLGSGVYDEKESGKFERLRAICETIYEKREKVLVFTQFKEMTEPLHGFLKTIFEREGLILHGSIPVKKRKTIIEKFQGKEYVPFMILSLKAGGVGLNLTEANHVIHFDRWWNPAVENQATDRAFRIGQKKNVMVHKFLTRGTVEEKIDLMLESKRRLAGEVIASTGEGWITEMGNEDLLELFKLTL